MKPGDTLHCWWDSSLEASRYASVGVVVASSRSKRKLTTDETFEALRDAWDEGVMDYEVLHWTTFTKAQAEAGEMPDETDVGSFGFDGWGKAWIDVAVPLRTGGF